MKRFTMFASLALIAVFAVSALAADVNERPQLNRGGSAYTAPTGDFAKASRETLYLIGSPGSFDGRFETPDGDADWQGWTSVDVTAPATQRWNDDTYNAENLGGAGNHAAWCGAMYPPCGDLDVEGGYGNSWNEMLNFTAPAPDVGQPTSVVVNYDANFNTEPAFDFTELKYERGDGGMESVFIIDDNNQGMLDQSIPFSVQPVDYVGEDNDMIHLQ